MKSRTVLTALALAAAATTATYCSCEIAPGKVATPAAPENVSATPAARGATARAEAPTGAIAADTAFLHTWQATAVISPAQASAAGPDRLFTASAIDSATRARMQGKSYRTDCRVPLDDLRLLRIVHRNAQGHTQLGEMVCNRAIAPKLLRIFRKLYEANYKIERIRLIDEYDADDQRSMADNNTSCFCYREVAGTTKLSKHSLGLAVDLNTLYNPYVFTRQGRRQVQPKEGERYAFNRERRNDIPYKIDHNDLAFRLFKAEGFTWGGDWRSVKDYQHFEYDL